MKKKIVIISTVVIVLIALVMLTILGFKTYDHIRYNDFYDVANREFYIPGLMDGFVPQGFDYVEEEKVFIACGYMNDDEEASRVYVISEDGDEFHYVELVDVNGDPYTGHTGGIAYYEEYAYITGATGIDVFELSEILKPGKDSRAFCRGSISTEAYDIDPAFCFVYDGELYTGEFQDEGDYQTDKKHHDPAKTGDTNKALMVSFGLSSYYNEADEGRGRFYVEPLPSAMYSIPSRVQGVCVADGKMFLSTSWGLDPSNIYVYDLEKVMGAVNSTYAKNTYGVTIPLYFVNSLAHIDTIEAPPMAEEIVFHDGKLWIFNESGSNKYIFGKFTTGNYLYSYNYPQPVEE